MSQETLSHSAADLNLRVLPRVHQRRWEELRGHSVKEDLPNPQLSYLTFIVAACHTFRTTLTGQYLTISCSAKRENMGQLNCEYGVGIPVTCQWDQM